LSLPTWAREDSRANLHLDFTACEIISTENIIDEELGEVELIPIFERRGDKCEFALGICRKMN